METAVVSETPTEKTKNEDVDDIDVFLYSDSTSQNKAPVMTSAPVTTTEKITETAGNRMLFSSQTLGHNPPPPLQQKSSSAAAAAFDSTPVVKKPVRITIPPGKAQQMKALGQLGSTLMHTKEERLQYSLGSSQDDEQYFAGPKSPPKVEEDEDFDLLLFSRSEQQPKKKNLFPFFK